MPVPFDQIPPAAWQAVLWFCGESGVKKPDMCALRAAVGMNLLYPTAISWAVKHETAIPESKLFVTNYGVGALHWLADSPPPVQARTETSAAPTGEPADSRKAVRPDKLSAAIAMKMKHTDWSAAKIAEAVGCSGAYLSNQPRWQAAVKAIKDSGKETKPRSDRHRGRDMDQYQSPLERGAGPRCECGDPAGADADGGMLTHGGKPRCPDCWAELGGGG